MKLRGDSIDNDLFFVVSELLKLLRVPRRFDPFFLWYHPGYPSLLSIKDSLIDSGVSVEALRFDHETINDIPTPAITYFPLETGGNEFVIIRSINAGIMSILSYNQGAIRTSINDIKDRWNGDVIIVDKDSTSYLAPEKENEKLGIYILRAVAILLSAAFITLVSINIRKFGADPSIAIIATYLPGLFITIILLTKQFSSSQKNWLADKFCGPQGDCDAVLNSQGANIFRWLSLSEAGFVYFAGSILSIMFAAIANVLPTAISISAALSFLSLLFVAFSIYYQRFVAGSWCSLCLTLDAVLAIQAAVFVFYLDEFLINEISTVIGIYTLCFVVPGSIWLLFKLSLISNSTIKDYRERLFLFRSDTSYFEHILNKEASLTRGDFDFDLVLGSTHANVHVVAFVSFNCTFCFKVFRELLFLHEKFSDGICIKVLMMPKSDDVTIDPFFIALASGPKQNIDLFLRWLDSENTIPRKSKLHSVNMIDKATALTKDRMSLISNKTIEHLPEVFLNNRRIANGFSILDFEFYIRRKISYNS